MYIVTLQDAKILQGVFLYKDVTAAARETMRQIIDRMESISVPPEIIQKKLLELANELCAVSGKKQYGYLKKPLKEMVDSSEMKI